MDGLFHSPQRLTGDEERDARTRPFLGDGSEFLRVPGLLSLEAVRLGRLEVPLTERIELSVGAAAERLREVELPVVILQEDENGEPVLLRSIRSNDGHWQAKQIVYVTGEWAEAPRGRKGA